MKKLHFNLVAATLFIATVSLSQTNPVDPVTPSLPDVTVRGEVGQGVSDLWKWASNLQPFTTNSTAMIQGGAGINTSDEKPIAAVMLTIPTSDNGVIQSGVSFAGWYHRD